MSRHHRTVMPTPAPSRTSWILPNERPTEAEVAALHAPAAKVIADLDLIWAEASDVYETLVESRFQGSLWNEAAEADRVALLDGVESSAVADLMRGEPDRLGRAHAVCSTAVARNDARRAKGAPVLAKAVAAADAQAQRLIGEVEELARAGWATRDTAAGLAKIEQAEELRARAERVLAVGLWCDGHSKELRQPGETYVPLDPEVRGILAAAEHDRLGRIPVFKPKGFDFPAGWTPRTVLPSSIGL